jgi:hypothetical protein
VNTAWIINPADQCVTEAEIGSQEIEELLAEIYSVFGADKYKLDADTNLCCSDAVTNRRFCWYMERMGGDFSVRRYGRGLITGDWDQEAVAYYLRFTYKLNGWEEVIPIKFYGKDKNPINN